MDDSPIRRTFDYAPGVQINYEVHGNGTKPLVLLHGFGASLETWRHVQPFLERDFLLYLIDLKGFGLSSKTIDNAYSLEDQACIIGAFIRQQHLVDACLIGHSYGGAVAEVTYLQMAEDSVRGRVTSIVLIAAPAATQRLPLFISPLRNPVFRPLLQLAPANARARFVLKHLVYDRGRVSEEQVERYARFLGLPGAHAAMAAAARQILPKDPDAIAGRLNRIDVPVLLIWGDRDRVVPRWQADLLASQLPASKLAIIPQCGHMPPEEWPEATAREILSFLAR